MLPTKNGFTFIEFLISLAFLSLLMVQLVNSFIASKHSVIQQTNLMVSVDKSMRLSHFLHQHVQSAGNIGCAKLSKTYTITNQKDNFSFSNKLTIESEHLHIRYARSNAESLIQQNKNELLITNDKTFRPNDIILISDCRFSEMAAVVEVNHTKDSQRLILSQPLINNYGASAQVAVYVHKDIFLNKSEGIVYIKDVTQRKAALVDSVAALNFFYNILRNNQFLTITANELHEGDDIVGLSAEWRFVNDENSTWPFFAKLMH